MNHLLRLDFLEVSCSCDELFYAACKTSAGGLRNLFSASFTSSASFSLSSSSTLSELFSVASSLTPSPCGSRFVELCSHAWVEVSCSSEDFLCELFSAASSLTPSWGSCLVDLFLPASCDCELFSAASSLTRSWGGRLVDLSRLPPVIVAAVACVIFSVQFLLLALHVVAVHWLIVSVLFLPAARQQMDLYLTQMFYLPQSSIAGNLILRIVFCPMPCPSTTLPVKLVVWVRSILHLANTACVSSSKCPPSFAHI